jgi:hypothetical protein
MANYHPDMMAGLPNARRYFTPAEDREIMAARASGERLASVALRQGRAPDTVRRRAKKLSGMAAEGERGNADPPSAGGMPPMEAVKAHYGRVPLRVLASWLGLGDHEVKRLAAESGLDYSRRVMAYPGSREWIMEHQMDGPKVKAFYQARMAKRLGKKP